MRLTVVGSINLDFVATAPRLPRAGETVTGATLARHPGGKGANQALAAQRLGAEVCLVGRVGRDAMAGEAMALLLADDVDVAGVVTDPSAPTGVALIAVDLGGENQIVVAAGANHSLMPEQLPARIETPLILQLILYIALFSGFAAAGERQSSLQRNSREIGMLNATGVDFAVLKAVERRRALRTTLKATLVAAPVMVPVAAAFNASELGVHIGVGVTEVTVQGKYVRFHPVELPESRVVRLQRLHPKSLYKAPVATMLVPRPQPPGFGAPAPRDEELLAWARQVIDGVIAPDQVKAPA